MHNQLNLYRFISLLMFLCLSYTALAEEPTAAPPPAASEETQQKQEFVLKISEEAVASLASQLSKEQFALLEKTVVGQPYKELDLSALKTAEALAQEKAKAEAEAQTAAATSQAKEETAPKPPTSTQTPSPSSDTATVTSQTSTETISTATTTDEGVVVFSAEDLEKIRNSLNAYLDILTKIQQVAPLIEEADKIRNQIQKLESGLDTLLKDEKAQVEAELVKHKEQLEVYLNGFKTIANQFDFQSINFEKLPGMITDLGYDSSFYTIIFGYLSEYIGLVKKVKTASSINESQVEVDNAIKEIQAELNIAKTEQEKSAIAQELEKLVTRKNTLKNEFTLNATGIDISTLEQQNTKQIDAQAELIKVFSPLIVGLTEFTEPSRRIEFLRSTVANYEQHIPKIRDGLKQLEVLIADTQDDEVKQNLLKEQEYWQNQEKEFSTKLEVAKQQLLELENRKLSASDAFNQFAQAVFSKRGLNILLSIVFFFTSFMVLMLLRRLILFINPFSYIPHLRFVANIIDVLLYLLTFFVATVVLLVSLFASGEVLALALVLVILLGMGWALRNAIPKFTEQLKLLVGYGTVRQNEKVMYEGIAWKVESIGIYSYLVNPLLTGGRVRLPIRDLIDLRSRPFDGARESLFPCREGDCVLINQKDWRHIIMQTPERITFEWYGMEESMPTEEFLEQNILNLSRNPFWVMANIEIAYRHRFDATGKIVTQLNAYLEEEFKKLPFGEHLLLTWVGLGSMTDTSLNMLAWVRVAAEAAPKYNAIKTNLNKICLEAANQYDWEVLRFHAIQQQPATNLQRSELLEAAAIQSPLA